MIPPAPPLNIADVVRRLSDAFATNFADGREVGAAVSLWQDGRELFHAAAGFRDAAREEPWEDGTLVLVWSATKGMASACALHALQSAGLAPNVALRHFWPEFARNGKERVTVADVLSHRAGLAAIEKARISIFDHDAVVRALEEQEPLWPPGSGHGYSPRTFGFLADEMVRKLTGQTLGEYWREVFAEPMHLDFWIGLPAELHPRVAQILAPRISKHGAPEPFLAALGDPESLTRAAFSSIEGLGAVSAMNSPVAREASLPSLGGIGTATSLAKFYSMLAANGEWQGVSYFLPETLQWMQTRLANGFDKTLLLETAFSAGFMLDPVDRHGHKTRRLFGPSLTAFGHPGAGGSMAFADPARRLGFAYVMNQMEIGVLPNERARRLVEAVFLEK